MLSNIHIYLKKMNLLCVFVHIFLSHQKSQDHEILSLGIIIFRGYVLVYHQRVVSLVVLSQYGHTYQTYHIPKQETETGITKHSI